MCYIPLRLLDTWLPTQLPYQDVGLSNWPSGSRQIGMFDCGVGFGMIPFDATSTLQEKKATPVPLSHAPASLRLLVLLKAGRDYSWIFGSPSHAKTTIGQDGQGRVDSFPWLRQVVSKK